MYLSRGLPILSTKFRHFQDFGPFLRHHPIAHRLTSPSASASFFHSAGFSGVTIASLVELLNIDPLHKPEFLVATSLEGDFNNIAGHLTDRIL